MHSHLTAQGENLTSPVSSRTPDRAMRTVRHTVLAAGEDCTRPSERKGISTMPLVSMTIEADDKPKEEGLAREVVCSAQLHDIT